VFLRRREGGPVGGASQPLASAVSPAPPATSVRLPWSGRALGCDHVLRRCTTPPLQEEPFLARSEPGGSPLPFPVPMGVSPASSWPLVRLAGVLIAIRCALALMIRTSFAPDEYWQGPEVAHRVVRTPPLAPLPRPGPSPRAGAVPTSAPARHPRRSSATAT